MSVYEGKRRSDDDEDSLYDTGDHDSYESEYRDGSDSFTFTDDDFEEETAGAAGGNIFDDLTEFDPDDEDNREDQDFEDIDNIDELLDYDAEVEALLEDEDDEIPDEDLALEDSEDVESEGPEEVDEDEDADEDEDL